MSFKPPTNEADLEALVNSTAVSENEYFDFKAILPSEGTSRDGKIELKKAYRKALCAFANSKGGYLIVGVKETGNGNSKKFEISGSTVAGEVNTIISQLIGGEITPSVDFDVASSFHLGGGLYCHVIHIKGSPSYRKPHVYDERVYFRRPGESRPAKSNSEIREIMESDYFFSPGPVALLDNYISVLRASKGKDLSTSLQRYHENLRCFLYDNQHNGTFGEVYSLFTIFETLRNKREWQSASSSNLSDGDQSLERFNDAIEQFANKLKKALEWSI